MKLYGSLTSPYVRKVRVLLAEKKIEHEFVESIPAIDNTELAAANPLGKVPALQMDNGEWLIDSGLHVQYIDSLPGEQFIPDDDSRWTVLNWHELGSGICDAVVARMLEGRRTPECQNAEGIKKQELKVERALQYAEDRIGDNDFLVGSRLTLADISLGVALAYTDLRYPHDWRSNYPNTASWFEIISQRDAFMDTAFPEA